MIEITDKTKCCGCAACVNICPKSCISMVKDNEGFYYPSVDSSQCINCNKCEAVCPERAEIGSATHIKVYSALAKDTNMRMASSSGGLFTALAEKIINQNGVVYGVSMSDDCHSAYHIKVDSIEGLAKLRGSKYLQTVPMTCYAEIKENLKNNILVLFSGTTCQVNGLLGYLGKDYENLVTVDVVCHGVPSQALWDKYISNIEEKYKSTVTAINFRHKKKGWANFGIERIENGRRFWTSKENDPYMRMFLNNYCLRLSCYECHAKSAKKSDITLADFWGVGSFTPTLNDGRGTSLVFARTAKGQALFDSISDDIKFQQVTYEQAVMHNPAEHTPAKKPPERDVFFDDMLTMSFDELSKKYCKPIKWTPKRIKSMLSGTVLWSKIRRIVRGGVTAKHYVPYEYGIAFDLKEK